MKYFVVTSIQVRRIVWPAVGITSESAAERVLSPRDRARCMIDGSNCPDCSGHVSTDDGTTYVCDDCDREFDAADLFLP